MHKRIAHSDLLRIILAAEMSTRSQFRGMGSDHRHLLELANEWMHRKEGFQMRQTVDDCHTITRAVMRELRPVLREMLREFIHSSVTDAHIDQIINQRFPDDLTIDYSWNKERGR